MTPTDVSMIDALSRSWLKILFHPAARTYWGYLLTAVVVVLVLGLSARARGRRSGRDLLRQWIGPSARVDYLLILIKPLFFALWALPWVLTAHGIAVFLVRRADRIFGRPEITGFETWQVGLVYTVVLFVAWDLSRYVLHRAMHHIEALWQVHQVHHSAETLTPFTLYRVHPIESALYQARGILVTGLVTAMFYFFFRGAAVENQLLGVNALGVTFSALGGNLRHSHTFWRWGDRLERWFISPAQHQLHHAKTHASGQVNYGTWLAVWDRIGGSLRLADGGAPEHFGLHPDDRNHDPHTLVSVLLDPVLAIIRKPRSVWARRPWALGFKLGVFTGGLMVPSGAAAQALAVEPAPPNEAGTEDADVDLSDFYKEPSSGDGADDGQPPKMDAKADDAIEPDVDTRGVAADIATPTVSIIGEPEDLPRIVGSAHLVDEVALERYENDDIQRILRTVPGVYVRGEDGFGLRPNIGLRGVDPNRSSKITLMEDGILLGPAPYAAPAAYYFPMTTRMVGIEVFKGPAAVRYGPNTIGGAINLRTRDIPRESDGGLDLALGERGYGKAHGHWGRSWKHFGVLVEGVRIQSNGFKELDGGGDTGFGKNEGMIKLRANLDPAARVYHQFDAKMGISTERSYETYLGLTDADFEANPYRRYVSSQNGQMRWWRSQAQLRYLLAYGDLVELQTTAYRNDFSRAWTKFNSFRGGPSIENIMADGGGQSAIYLAILRGEEDSTSNDEALMIGTNDRRYVSQGIQNTLRISPRTKYVDQTIEFGARFHADSIRRDHTEEGYRMVSSTLVPEQGDEDQTTLNRGAAYAGALHLHDEVVFVDRFTLSPGARVELIRTDFKNDLDESQSSTFNAIFVPGIGAHVQATEWLGVLAGVHSGFSPVAPGQADDVQPERSVNYEGGVRLGGETLAGFTAEAIGFFNDYSNLTGECTFAQGCDDSNIGEQFNAGRVKVAGAEIAAGFKRRFKRNGWIDTDANYTFTWSRFERSFVSASPQFGIVEAGDALPYLPVNVASLKLAGGMKKWGLWGTLAYNGQMRDSPGQGGIPAPERIDRFLTFDLGGRVWVNERASIYMNMMNVTGAEYMVSRRPFGARPGRPRFASIGFKYDFGS